MAGAPSQALQVAREFFALAKRDDDRGFTAMKLLKLLYYAQAWSLYERRQPLFSETVKAWDDGPVVPSLWHEVKGYFSIPRTHENLGQPSELSDVDRAFVHGIWQLYKHLSGDELSELTHLGTAFRQAREQARRGGDPSPAVLPEDMRAEIEEYLQENSARFTAFLAGLESSHREVG